MGNTEELKNGGAAGGEGTAPDASTTTPAPDSAPVSKEAPTQTVTAEMEAAINEAIQKVRAEYEGKDGHISKLKSKVDTLKKELRRQQQGDYEQAIALWQQGDPEQAAQVLAGIVQETQQRDQFEQYSADVTEWQEAVLEDLGFAEDDEEAAELAAEWLGLIVDQGKDSHAFIMKASQLQQERKNQELDKISKEMQSLKDSLPAMITQALVNVGLAPDVTGEGGAPTDNKDDWRDLPEGQLIKRGLAERRKAPVIRKQ